MSPAEEREALSQYREAAFLFPNAAQEERVFSSLGAYMHCSSRY